MVKSTSISIEPATHGYRHVPGAADPISGVLVVGGTDLCSGLTPTIAGDFTTPANALGNITDGDDATFTGVGTVDTDPIKEDIISIDLGAIKSVSTVRLKCGFRGEQGITSDGKIEIRLESSGDGTTWVEHLYILSSTDNTWESYDGILFVGHEARYLRFRATVYVWSGYLRIREYKVAAIEAYEW